MQAKPDEEKKPKSQRHKIQRFKKSVDLSHVVHNICHSCRM